MKAVEFGPGWITLRGRRYAITKPAASDLQRIAARMRELALPTCTNPILEVNAVAGELKPVVLAALLEIAGNKKWGGGVEPSPEAVARQYDSLEGVRWQFWFLVTREPGQKDVSLEQITDLVGEAERYDLADAILGAVQLPAGGEADPKASEAGANSSPASTGT